MDQSPKKMPDPSESIGFMLHHASYVFKTALKDGLKSAGVDVTPEEFVFLATVPEEGELQSVLAKRALKDKTTITRLIDRLVRKGLVYRTENPADRREQRITLTGSGADVRQDALMAAIQLIGRATDGISNTDMETTKRVLLAVMENLAD